MVTFSAALRSRLPIRPPMSTVGVLRRVKSILSPRHRQAIPKEACRNCGVLVLSLANTSVVSRLVAFLFRVPSPTGPLTVLSSFGRSRCPKWWSLLPSPYAICPSPTRSSLGVPQLSETSPSFRSARLASATGDRMLIVSKTFHQRTIMSTMSIIRRPVRKKRQKRKSESSVPHLSVAAARHACACFTVAISNVELSCCTKCSFSITSSDCDSLPPRNTFGTRKRRTREIRGMILRTPRNVAAIK